MKKRSIIFTLASSAALIFSIVPPGKLSSCGPSLGADESRLALFRTGMDDNSGLRPFYYSESLFNLTDTDPEKIDQQKNCSEWQSFSNKEAKKADVFSIQYQTTPDSFLAAYKANDWKGFAGNSFIQWLQKKENHASLEYIALAKQAEAMFIPAPDPWDTSTALVREQSEGLSRSAVYAVSQNLPGFLQERYAFQAVKLLYYNNNEQKDGELIRIYDQHLKGKASIVSAWALIYYAMRLKDPEERTLYLVKAFDASEEKKRFCYQQLSMADLESLKKKTSDSKIIVLTNTIEAIKSKGKSLQNIQAVYKNDPQSKYLPLLISREINKLENWLWSPEILGFYDNYRADHENETNKNYKTIRAADLQYLAEVRSWLESTTLTNNRPYEQLALIHLLNMEQKQAQAQLLIDQLPVKLNDQLEMQRQIEKLICISQRTDIKEPVVKEQVASSIKKMMVLNPVFKHQMDSGFSDQERFDRTENEDDLSELLILLSNSYKKVGDMITASLLFNKASITINEYTGWNDDKAVGYKKIAYLDRNGGPEDIDKILQFKHTAKRTSFDQLITPASWGPDDMYRDLKGTILLRRKKYKEALAVFNTMNPAFWNDNYEFKDYLPTSSVMFTGYIIPGEKAKPAEYPYVSKKLIVKDIVDLQEKISSTTDTKIKAALYYKLANCYFNISYFGKAWMAFSYGKSYMDWGHDGNGNYNWAWYSFYPNSIKYGADYYGCRDAIATYKTALSLTKDNELAAKCLLSLHFIETTTAEYPKAKSNKREVKMDYLRILTTKYKQTYNFKQALINCPDVKDYVDGKKN